MTKKQKAELEKWANQHGFVAVYFGCTYCGERRDDDRADGTHFFITLVKPFKE